MKPTSPNTSDQPVSQESTDHKPVQENKKTDKSTEATPTSGAPAQTPSAADAAPAKQTPQTPAKETPKPAAAPQHEASRPVHGSIPPATPPAPAMHAGSAPKHPFSWAGALAIASLILAAGASVCAVMVWQRMGQMEQQLQFSQQGSSSAAEAAKVLAQQSLDMSNSVSGKLAHASAQLDSLSEQSNRIDSLIQYINNAKTETLSADLRTAVQSAQLQTQLTGSVEPLLITLKAIDDRLLQDNQSVQSPLRQAIARDMETIRNAPVPDPVLLSTQISELIRKVDTMPLMIDPPPLDTPPASAPVVEQQAVSAQPDDTVAQTDTDTAPAPQAPAANETPAAPAPEPSFWQKSWQWTTAKSAQLGSAVWDELSGLVVVRPINNPDATLLSPEQGAILRENVKLRLLNLRISVLQRQFALAQSELQDLQDVITRYYNPNSRAVQDILGRLKALQSGMQSAPLPQPEATLGVLATIDTRH